MSETDDAPARRRTRGQFVEQPGDADAFVLKAYDLAEPGEGEVGIAQAAIGVNFHDIYVRSGLYRTLALPGIPGIDAVGYVDRVGPGVSTLREGDRVVYVAPQYGAYAAGRNLPAWQAMQFPAAISDEAMAATFMKALTTCVLVSEVCRLSPGQRVLVHAAAGGMGQLLCSWASALGAQVIGTVGSEQKAQVARRAGASATILYREQDVAACVADLTDGRGVDVVYDAVGADTFAGSLASLGFCGRLVLFGQSSGPVPPFAPGDLASKSLSISRPILFHYIRTPDRLQALADQVFAALERGFIRPLQPLRLALEDVAEAHRTLEAGKSPGGIVLIP